MNKFISLFVLLCLFQIVSNVSAQNNVGVGVLNPHPSSLLELSASDKGFLVPRMDSVSRNQITNPAQGLLVYDTDYNDFWYFDGVIWRRAVGPAGQQGAQGPAGPLVPGTFGQTLHHDGTTWVANSLLYNDGTNVGVGNTSPAERLSVTGNIAASGIVYWGNDFSRTETRDDAGLQGNAGAKSGYFETNNPINFPAGANNWWHLIDTRHSNNTNNYALQIAGSFFDQRLFFRKTNNNPATPWTEVLTTATPIITQVVSQRIEMRQGPGTNCDNCWHTTKHNNDFAMIGISIYATDRLDGDVRSQGQEVGFLENATFTWYGRYGATTENGIANTDDNGVDNTEHFANCPANHIATGFEAYATSRLDGRLKLRCTALKAGYTTTDNAGNGGTGGIESAVSYPYSNGSAADDVQHGAFCPAGTWMNGIRIYASDRLDGRMRVYCTAIR